MIAELTKNANVENTLYLPDTVFMSNISNLFMKSFMACEEKRLTLMEGEKPPFSAVPEVS